MAGAELIDLVPHPGTPPPPGLRATASARRTPNDVLTMVFRLAGDLAGVRIPPARPAGVVDGLWRHTCFEVFVAPADGTAYHELNVAPSGEWALYAFRAYRERAPLSDGVRPPGITVERSAQHVLLAATVPLVEILSEPSGVPLRLGLTAVLEDATGLLSYWSLHHPSGPPDFHHSDVRILHLEAPDGSCEGDPS